MAKNTSIASEWAARFSSLLDDRPQKLPVYSSNEVAVLTPAEMTLADKATVAAGTPGIKLMHAAGVAVADTVVRRVPAGSRVAVIAGPGNNGGDGFVAAAVLADSGYQVTVGLLAGSGSPSGDAGLAAGNWGRPIEALSPSTIRDAEIIVDALFGAGLSRPVEGVAASVIEAVNGSGVPVVAVDLPSGINGTDGSVLGTAVKADETVTFFRRKPGHILLPGRAFAGRISVVDIGIAEAVLETIASKTFYNVPEFWRKSLPLPSIDGHKYDRGHVIVVSGPMMRTGASRLAARGALRIGAGLVTVAASADAAPIHAAHLTAIMILPMDGPIDLVDILADERRNAVVLGPALGVGEKTTELVEAALGMKPAIVLDADALTSFSDNPDKLFELIKARKTPTVLTPHDGEFGRIFPDLADTLSKIDRVRQAASRSGAYVVLKGPDTVVGAPDGRVAIADNAPPDLATAGSGDVLAGMICGLLAQRMSAFEACAAAVWMHGAAARTYGRGLIAEDIPEALPVVLAGLGQ